MKMSFIVKSFCNGRLNESIQRYLKSNKKYDDYQVRLSLKHGVSESFCNEAIFTELFELLHMHSKVLKFPFAHMKI